MPDAHRLSSLARNLQARAKEILARAETFQDADARQKMLRLAANYEELAKRLEQQSCDAEGLRAPLNSDEK